MLLAVNTLGIADRNIKMNYENYETTIQHDLKIQIVSWPKDVEFKNPSNITSVVDLCKLHDAWKYGDAFWEKMSKSDLTMLPNILEARRLEFSSKKSKPRKKRSDVGKKQACRDADEGDKENRASCKEARTSKAKGKRRAIIADSDADYIHLQMFICVLLSYNTCPSTVNSEILYDMLPLAPGEPSQYM